MAHDEAPPLYVLRRIAAAADADPRTVKKFLLGKPIKGGAVTERIAAAVKKWRENANT